MEQVKVVDVKVNFGHGAIFFLFQNFTSIVCFVCNYMSIFAPGSHRADHVVEGPFNPGTDMPTPGCLVMSQNLWF